MDFVPLAVAAALVWKIIDTINYGIAGNVRAVLTQVGVWFAGVVVALLLAASDFASTFDLGGILLGDLNIWSLILFGSALGSSASVGVDFKKAVDNTDSAHVPS